MNKEVRNLIRSLERQGAEVRKGQGGHNKVYRDGKLVYVFPATPSGGNRAMKNARAGLRRIGFDV
jgi:hypothetical protein